MADKAKTEKAAKAAETKPKAEAKAPKPAKVKGPTIGGFALDCMKKGMSNADVLKAVQEKFPEAKTGMASINWYRNKAMSEGVPGVKSSREITSAATAKRKAEEAKAKKAADAAAKATEKVKAAKGETKAPAKKANGKAEASAGSALD